MRIISKFHDYYDKAMGLGIDPKVTYVRKTEEVEQLTEYHKYRNSSDYQHLGKTIKVFANLLGFCGGFYPYYEFWMTAPGSVNPDEYDKSFAWSKEQYVEYILEHPQDPNRYSEWWSGNMLPDAPAKYGMNYHNHFARIHAKNDEIFREHRSPVIAFSGDTRISTSRLRTPYQYKLVLNPNLTDMQFYKVMDGYKVFQEISMYVGGVISRSDAGIVEISDEDMRDKKGFDKTSFKTASPGKKSNRRAR